MIRSHFGIVRQVLAVALSLTPGSLDAQERLVAVDSVGSSGGDRSFGRIVDVAVSTERRLAVSQHGIGEVWVFDSGGDRQIVGRSGEGPGDFGFAPSVAWRSDTLVVVEDYRQRVSLMASDGRYIGGRTTRSAAPSGHRPVGYLRSGLTVAAPETSSRSTAAVKPLLLIGAGDQVVASVGEIRHRRVMVTATLASGRLAMSLHPLPNRTRTSLSPDGRYFATADEIESREGSKLRFALYDDAGNRVGRTTANVITAPASKEDVLYRLRSTIEGLSENLDLPVASVRNSFLTAVERPDRLPALSSFLLDNGGRFWVGTMGKDGGVVWRAWSTDGGLERMWAVEPGLDVRQIHDGGAVAIRQDDVRGWRVIYLRPQGKR